MALTYATIPLQIHGITVELSTIYKLSFNAPILCLYGFGSCKEDLAALVLHADLQEYGFIAYDAPGCGHTKSDTHFPMYLNPVEIYRQIEVLRDF
ncbi:alpha/beta-hydrolase [Penicillium capsulatum]|uniref:Alpha/beta-hydrolase n=1 Tax=Penicillium capsulatum TaxID=69766 RepID=A0A9W9I3I4_9EURO|nr:alpha/beta-hydrolase [Penicillium capsulatum]